MNHSEIIKAIEALTRLIEGDKLYSLPDLNKAVNEKLLMLVKML